MTSQFWSGSQTVPISTGTTYAGLVHQGRGTIASETDAQQVIACAGAISELRVKLGTAPGSGKSWTITIRKNGVDALQVVISGTSTTAVNLNAFTVAPGDALSVSFVPSGTPTAPGSVQWAATFDGDVTGESPLLSCMLGSLLNSSSSGGNFVFPNGSAASTTAGFADRELIVALAGSITQFRVRTPFGMAIGAWTIALFKNGVATAMTATVTSQTAVSTGGPISVAPGDLITYRVLGSGTPAAQGISIGTKFVSSVNGYSMIMGGEPATNVSTSATTYLYPGGGSIEATNSGAANRGNLTNATSVRGLYVKTRVAPVGGDTWQINFMQNAVLSFGHTVSDALVNSPGPFTVNLNAGDSMATQSVPTGGPLQSQHSWTIILYTPPNNLATNSAGITTDAAGTASAPVRTGDIATASDGENGAATGQVGVQGPLETKSGGLESAGAGNFEPPAEEAVFNGSVETASAGESSAAEGTVAGPIAGGIETDSDGENTALIGEVNPSVAGDLTTESGGVSTAGEGTANPPAVEGTLETESGGLSTEGAGLVAGPGEIVGTIATEQSGEGTEMVGQFVAPVPPVIETPPAILGGGGLGGFRRRFLAEVEDERPPAIVGTIVTDSDGVETRAFGNVRKPSKRPVGDLAPLHTPPAPEKPRTRAARRKARALKRTISPRPEPIFGAVSTFAGPNEGQAKGINSLGDGEIEALLTLLTL
jgi:hypothetical protein